ncbi:MAG: amino acid adenylation domain-containing protein [Chloroflexi bacterium]|nr:amino acid adenylation domain-containing protein [Chloroflexota bacterium]
MATRVGLVNGRKLTEDRPLTAGPVGSAADEYIEYPLSYGQRALWFVQRLVPGNAGYNIVRAARIRDLDIPSLQRTAQRLLDRHPTFRTSFTIRDGEPVQRAHAHMEAAFRVVDASGWTDAELQDKLGEEVEQPFDLERGPLMRVAVFRRGPSDHVATLALHHIASDLWSLAVLLYEIGVIYTAEKNGTDASPSPPRGDYAEHVQAERELLAGPDAERLWAFWREQLAGELPVLDLPADRPRLEVQGYRGGSQYHKLGAELTARLRAFSEARGVPLYATMLAAFQVMLHRYTGQDDIIVGYPKAGRSPKFARSVGYFVNPVPIRARLDGDPTFSQFLSQVHRTLDATAEHDAYPFGLMVERLQPVRDLSRSPIFQVMFSWQKTTRLMDREEFTAFALGGNGGQMPLGELRLESVALERQVSPLDLTWLMAETSEECIAAVEYSADLFDRATIQRMLGHYRTLLESVLADPDRPLSHLPMLTQAEREQFAAWNATAQPYPSDRCAHQLVEEQAARTPQAPAVAFGGQTLTYGELERRANQLAHYLQALGVGPQTPVGLCVEPSLEMIVGVLGVQKAGGAYLPLDPTYPAERLAFMLEDARVPVLLTQQHLQGALPAQEGVQVVRLDADWPTISQEDEGRPVCAATPESLAYIIYTSGSTGKPKGTMLRHAGLCNLCAALVDLFGLGPASRVLQFASFSFDASVADIFPTLAAGGCLYLAPREQMMLPSELHRLLREWEITVVTLPPSMLALLPDEGLDALATVVSAGESCSREIAGRWARGRRFLNGYGPTETTVGASYYRVAELPPTASTVPIGRPIPNVQMYILDSQMRQVPVNVAGELYIGGVGVAQGYLNRDDLTAERFLRDPFGDNPASRLYRTGDLARYLADGNIEYLGRVDHQVKVRGFRVELDEIQALLVQHEAVQDAVVVAQQDATEAVRLVAYYVPRNGATPTGSGLRHFLRRQLPDYMVPALFVPLEALPLTPNGKVDRKALPDPDGLRPELEATFVMPRNEAERTIAAIWAEVLGVDKVGVEDNFFDLGGHSLAAAKVYARLQETFERSFSMVELFKYPTVSLLAEYISQQTGEATRMQSSQARAQMQREALQRQRRHMRAVRQKR